MWNWTTLGSLLAAAENAPAGGNEQQGSPFGALLMPMVAILFLWYFLILRPQRRDQGKRNDMLKALKKNDRVATVGGIIGTVANISADGKEVTIRVDDNTRIRFLRSSIQSVLTGDLDEGSK